MAEKLKKEFIELLEKDVEFRYTVAGYIGMSEVLKRLDKLEEGQNKLWEEMKSLREGQNKLWEEVKGLRDGQNMLWEEVKSLRESQNKLWEEVKDLRIGQDGMRKYMVSGFKDLGRALGVTFEHHAASFLEILLEEMGYPDAKVEKKYLVEDGEVIEIDIFCEKPLVIGEATVNVWTLEEAEREVKNMVRRAELVMKKYRDKPILTVLSVARASPEASETLKTLAERHGIKLVLGKEMEEMSSI